MVFHMNGRLGWEEIMQATNAPKMNVITYWPLIVSALEEFDIGQKLVQVGAVATIATEVPKFAPIKEFASGEAYEGRKDLGNTSPGDGVRYKGRGFIQITGRGNYQYYGSRLAVDLVGNPELACQPDISARILGMYFRDRGVAEACKAYNWKLARKKVNGGYNGLERFMGVVRKLLGENAR